MSGLMTYGDGGGGEECAQHSPRVSERESASGISIVPMEAGDLEQVAALDALVSNPAWSRAMFESEFTTNQFAAFFVARERGERAVRGYLGCWIVFDELHLLNVAVHPGWRRRGIARRLVHTAMERAEASGAIRGLLEVRASNDAAQHLYAGFGFRVMARRSRYYTEPVEDALIMECAVGGA